MMPPAGAGVAPILAGIRKRRGEGYGALITPALFSRPLPPPAPGEEGEKQTPYRLDPTDRSDPSDRPDEKNPFPFSPLPMREGGRGRLQGRPGLFFASELEA